jgi:hypothetical protein
VQSLDLLYLDVYVIVESLKERSVAEAITVIKKSRLSGCCRRVSLVALCVPFLLLNRAFTDWDKQPAHRTRAELLASRRIAKPAECKPAARLYGVKSRSELIKVRFPQHEDNRFTERFGLVGAQGGGCARSQGIVRFSSSFEAARDPQHF